MDSLSLFDCFQAFVDDDAKFRRFIESCNGRARKRGELTYSQEGIWERFINANPDFADCDFESILATFQICHLHMLPMRSVQIPIRKDLIDEYFSPEYEAKMMEHPHPFSATYVYDSPAWGDATHIDSLHCDECIAIRQRLGK